MSSSSERPTSPQRPTSATTAASHAFVAAHRPEAEAHGRRLTDLIHDPDAFVSAAREAFEALADPAYRAGTELVAPGIGPTFGVRNPLQDAVRRSLARGLRGLPPAVLLPLADHLSRDEHGEMRWLAIWLTGRVLPTDPERAWQLLRRFSREAGEWITVDTLAERFGQGILREPYRWAELEQLVFSPSRWERRLVGSTLAELPFVDRVAGRAPEIAVRGLSLLDELIGDAEPDVQKALSWALRSLTLVDLDAVAAFSKRQAQIAATSGDGHRAWVVRDALSKLPIEFASTLRASLGGIRKRRGAPSTSRAAETAATFLAESGLPSPRDLPEPPLTSAPATGALAEPAPAQRTVRTQLTVDSTSLIRRATT